ncbi:hypothetical protein Glove_16g166 [Diversispora epigaea]|uniref:Uncharacterized protein n=1 Tax=Diversispora epigaea TaxID=1348612 RepID=A0A397JR17_9GLOM|nr:hypothetical protein Glove_16g166 [Diversispora epigaea]
MSGYNNYTFKDCRWRFLNNSSLKMTLDTCKNLNNIIIYGSNQIVPKTVLSIPERCTTQIKIIKEAFRLRYKKDSKHISEYAGYVKNLCNAENQDEYIKYTAITLFPNDEAYNKRMPRYRKWYQSKKELLTSVEDLYNLYYKLSKKDRPMTETEIEEAVEDVLIDE